ncbi:MAG: hypothetical protein AAFV01_14100, partial [Bacteroidota bacterium]
MQRYLICPDCRNEGFIPSDEFKQPCKNLGGKRYAGPAALRTYVCLQCGYTWENIEHFHREVRVRVKGDNNDG